MIEKLIDHHLIDHMIDQSLTIKTLKIRILIKSKKCFALAHLWPMKNKNLRKIKDLKTFPNAAKNNRGKIIEDRLEPKDSNTIVPFVIIHCSVFREGQKTKQILKNKTKSYNAKAASTSP